MLYNLKAMKAGQAASTQNAGLKNIFGGIGNAAMLGMEGNKNNNNNNNTGNSMAGYDDSLPK